MSGRVRVFPLLVLVFFGLLATEGRADSVVLRDTTLPGGTTTSAISDFYVGEGHSSSIVAVLTSANTAGADLLILYAPSSALAPSELSVLASHLAAGRRIAIFGEYAAWNGQLVATINSTLSALGSSLSQQAGVSLLTGATVLAPSAQLPAHPLTAGVTSMAYVATGAVAGAGPGEAFLLYSDLVAVIGAEELVGGGSVVLALDSGLARPDTADHDQFLRNLLGPVGVPEPSVLTLLAIAGLGVALRRRRA